MSQQKISGEFLIQQLHKMLKLMIKDGHDFDDLVFVCNMKNYDLLIKSIENKSLCKIPIYVDELAPDENIYLIDKAFSNWEPYVSDKK